MQIHILEDKATRISFEIEGADHTICNMLKQELYEDETIKVAGYTINHPYVGKPKFIIETKQGGIPRKAITAAIKRLQKTVEDLSKKAAKELK
ncbi:MAG: DNA-directed RNA polymerase subunit L [Nanoarchaeota archaeon]